MRSWDFLRNFPELDGLPDDQARALIRDTQKRVSREPKVLAGLLAVAVVAGVISFSVLNLGGMIAGALIGGAVVVYMALVIKPRMTQAFREMGYPKKP